MLPLRLTASLRRRTSFTITGPAMPSRRAKEPNPNLMQMSRKNSKSRRARRLKKRNYAGPHSYRVIKEWPTGQQALLEDAEIEYEIYTEMKKFIHASGLKKTARHKAKETDIHLWKQYSKEYHNKRTNEWTRSFRCPMNYRCGCQAQVKPITGPDYKRLKFTETHDAQSHAKEICKKL